MMNSFKSGNHTVSTSTIREREITSFSSFLKGRFLVSCFVAP